MKIRPTFVEKDDPQQKSDLIELLKKLQDNQTFQDMRGGLGSSFRTWVEYNLQTSKSVSEANKKAEDFSQKFLVMHRLLAQLRSQGKSYAEQELEHALLASAYIMDYETFPEKDVVPYTVYMLEPEKTFRIFNFFRYANPSALRNLRFFHGILNPQKQGDTYLARALFEDLPSLRKIMQNTAMGDARGDYDILSNSCFALRVAYIRDVVCAFPALNITQSLDVRHRMKGSTKDHYFSRYWQHHTIENQLRWLDKSEETWRRHKSLFSGFCYLVPGAKQEILDALGDSEGLRIATWEFKLPRWLPERLQSFKSSAFEILDADDYSVIKDRQPVLTSDQMSIGYGMSLVRSVENHYFHDNKDRLYFGAYY